MQGGVDGVDGGRMRGGPLIITPAACLSERGARDARCHEMTLPPHSAVPRRPAAAARTRNAEPRSVAARITFVADSGGSSEHHAMGATATSRTMGDV